MKRIFVGIPISEELQKEILEWRNNNPSLTLPSEGEGKIIRWLEGKNLHITLVPPFDDAHSASSSWPRGQDLRPIIDELKKVKHQPFEIRFEKISFGPNIHQPRLIWASGPIKSSSFADDSEAVFNGVNELKLKIYDALGQQPENRLFQLHVTLARFKVEDFYKFKTKSLNEKVDWRQIVDGFALYESHLSPQGADYEILAEIKLV